MQLGLAASRIDRNKRFSFSPGGEGGVVLRADTDGGSSIGGSAMWWQENWVSVRRLAFC